MPARERIEGLVFDKDGTLTDFAASWGPLNREAAEYAGRGDPALARHLLAVGGDPGTGQARGGSLLAASSVREIASAWIDEGAEHDLDDLEGALNEIYSSGASRAVPVTDVAALFRRLRARGLCIGVATSDSERGARRTLASLNVDTADVFVAGYDSGHGLKPQPGMVHAFCEHVSLPPERVAVVGDNLHDIRMGRNAGCSVCVGVLTGTGTRAELAAEADHIVANIVAVEELL